MCRLRARSRKTFGLRQRISGRLSCARVFGNFLRLTAGSQRINGQGLPHGGFRSGVACGSTAAKLRSFTIATAAGTMDVQNGAFQAYQKLLGSVGDGGALTFQPIIWIVTAPVATRGLRGTLDLARDARRARADDES